VCQGTNLSVARPARNAAPATLSSASPVKKNLKDYKNHLKDAGFNGIYLNKCLHCFVREVTIVEPENALIHAAAASPARSSARAWSTGTW